jgi:hypothetical protein
MSGSNLNRNLVARASAVLTTAEVAATVIDLNDMSPAGLALWFDFTIGSLTNVILRVYVATDLAPTTWIPLLDVPAGTAVAATLTASATGAIALPPAPGFKWMRVTAQGTGTVTGSLLALTWYYLRRGAR